MSAGPGRGSASSTSSSPRRNTACRKRPTCCTTRRRCIGSRRSGWRRRGEVWAPRLAHLPRPYVTVILGGNSGPYSFDREAGALLGLEASRLARELGGSLLVTTSARTPPDAIDGAGGSSCDVPHELFRWRPDADGEPLSRLPGAGRPAHRHLRQHVDADRGDRDRAAGARVRSGARAGLAAPAAARQRQHPPGRLAGAAAGLQAAAGLVPPGPAGGAGAAPAGRGRHPSPADRGRPSGLARRRRARSRCRRHPWPTPSALRRG